MKQRAVFDSRFRTTVSRRGFLVLSADAAFGLATAGRFGVVAAQTASVTTTANGTFFDPSIVHEIAVTFDQTAYDAVIEAYKTSGDKEWLSATITIDGATYQNIGMRLKGNSSLMGLRMVEGVMPVNQTDGGETPANQTQGAADDSGDANVVRRGPGGEISAGKPETLPWLVRLDKYVDDQAHHGLAEFVIRSNNSKTALNEALALELLTAAGLASQLAASTAFSVNGGARALRLTIENPNDQWMATHFSADGLLYKSEASGDWSFRGDDPELYKDIFDLEAGGNGDDAEDFAPLTAFLDYLNNSDDPTFTAELAKWLDIEQFAVYLAIMELIDNFDDIDGPGNNSYLYTDGENASFTVVPWDMNLAFGGGGMRSEGPGAFGGNGPNFRTREPDGDESVWGMPIAGPSEGGPTFVQNGPGAQRAGGPGGMDNPLVKRFTAVADFATLVETTSARLRAELYESGAAAAILGRWVNLLEGGATSMVDKATITAESAAIAGFFTRTTGSDAAE